MNDSVTMTIYQLGRLLGPEDDSVGTRLRLGELLAELGVLELVERC